ncbi:MAG: Gfo/Idh/MocA family oxidoreductase [Candidatus Omnitrophica bacterium]|nr:Gfo/Idh/MocA family oxidoreductase [Candidatus Omnitrophota bacterium]
MKKKYALVGTGGRGVHMYAKPIVERYKDNAELVAMCDINPKRLKLANKEIKRHIPTYTNFHKMLKEVKFDTLIVATKDSTHHEFIIKALETGHDAITEKPMTTDDKKCRAILKAEKKSKKKLIVTFNYRYAPYTTRVKEFLHKDIIGDIISVDFQWYLDTSHGADYFRRWHRRKENSGGLLVHKATHHFDMLNWYLEDEPEEVFARGALRFYGHARKEMGVRCLTCKYKKTCKFYFDIEKAELNKKFYREAEGEDKYYRDRCVWSKEIDIEDTMAVSVRYKKGTFLSYTLNAFLPYEGWRMALNGKKGRLEAEEFHSFPTGIPDVQTIKIYPLFKKPEIIKVPKATGGHGGGDTRLLDMLFKQGIPDPLGHQAGSRGGAMSILIGVAGNKSIATGKPIKIKDLLK